MNEQSGFARKLAEAHEKGISTVDLQFIDIFGNIKFKTVSFDEFLHEKEYLKGYGVDGSSISGYGVPAEESDLIIMPDPDTFHILPWARNVSRVICDVHCPSADGKGKAFEGDARSAFKRVLAAMPEALAACPGVPAVPSQRMHAWPPCGRSSVNVKPLPHDRQTEVPTAPPKWA